MAGNWWDWDYNVYGGQGLDDGGGFGSRDLDEMRKAGRTDAQIRILANLAPSQGVKVYNPVQEWVRNNTEKPDWQYGAHGNPDFGLQDIEAAEKMSGWDYNKIKKAADYATEKGIGVAPRAQHWLSNWNPDTMGAGKTPPLGLQWMDYNFDEVGGPGMGVKDIDDMRRKGYSDAQIRILANTGSKRGTDVFGGAQKWVGENTQQLPWMYGAHGDERFGKMDLQAAQGHDFDTIKGYADFAREHGIGVSDYVENWLTGRQDQLDDAAQTQAIANQATIDADRRSDEQIAGAAANALLISQATDRGTAAMEAQRQKDRRVKTSSPLATGGTGSFRARGLTTSQNKRGGGTSQFRSTSPYFQSTLNTGSGKTTTAKSTLNI